MTTAGPNSRAGGTDATSSRSRPEIQWVGASKCVPTCSPPSNQFHDQAGPRSSKWEMTCVFHPGVLANGGGSCRTGVRSDSGWVRSTTRTRPAASPSTSEVRTVMASSSGVLARTRLGAPWPPGAGARGDCGALYGPGEVEPTDFRRLFPIFDERVYLNSCSQGALGRPVQAALEEFMESWHRQGNPWELWCERMEELRAEFAALINAEPDEVAVTFSASTAVSAVASALDWSERPRVVTSDLDFPTMGHVWLAQQTRGAEVAFAAAAGDRLPLEAFEAEIDRRTRLVATAHVCYRNGFKTDLAALARLAHAHGAPLLVDAFQSMGAEPLDVRALGVDALVTGTLKYLLGTPGVAFLYVRRELAERLTPTDKI